MKTNQKYVLLSVVTALALMGGSFAALSSAQAVTPLTCSVATSTVNTNQPAVFTAFGGNGSFSWSGPNLNVTNSAGAQFAVSYPNAGTYPITVTSAGLTATCNMSVVAPTSVGTVMCSPSVQTVTLGNNASFTATGGNGSYTWSSPDISISNPNGSGFSASYSSTGLKVMTVASNGISSTCAVNVLPSDGTVTPPVTTPGLPNTGGGFGQ